jgi:hypothetical protein
VADEGPAPDRSDRPTRLLRLYPAAWRRRYEAEVAAVLAERPLRPADRVDLVRGALDAHLHPERRSHVPGLCAAAGGALWCVAAATSIVQPAPPDWPGYLAETLGLLVAATVLLLGAVVGAWLRLGDAPGRIGRLGLVVAVAGHAAWAATLAVPAEPAALSIASAAAAIGTGLIGIALLRRDDWPVAGLLVVTADLELLGPGWPALGFGLGWTLVGLAMLRELDRDGSTRLAG